MHSYYFKNSQKKISLDFFSVVSNYSNEKGRRQFWKKIKNIEIKIEKNKVSKTSKKKISSKKWEKKSK